MNRSENNHPYRLIRGLEATVGEAYQVTTLLDMWVTYLHRFAEALDTLRLVAKTAQLMRVRRTRLQYYLDNFATDKQLTIGVIGCVYGDGDDEEYPRLDIVSFLEIGDDLVRRASQGDCDGEAMVSLFDHFDVADGLTTFLDHKPLAYAEVENVARARNWMLDAVDVLYRRPLCRPMLQAIAASVDPGRGECPGCDRPARFWEKVVDRMARLEGLKEVRT